jgi:acyl transferase domain-containing protein/thioesterase domain-containing protein
MGSTKIAIVGMAGRFPGARTTAEFWRNLRDGVESIVDLTESELLAAGASAKDLANPDYVRRAAILDGVSLFDASFFGFSPRDASIMDPQHRNFLECAWEALENSAHPPQLFQASGDCSIGVFAGSGMNTYLIHNLLANRHLLESAGLFQLKQTGNDKDVLATRVSYQFDLRGPSINVQTACSTSLVAVHLACQSLLNFECDMALAGGVTIEIPHGLGYVAREGEILSRDGHCRPFDASSSGTVFSSGMGVVVLRRLEDAVADNDHIHAVILGSAINNDGARKVGYLAPSIEGQAEVVAEALEYSGVPADSIAYVETHGTGTRVGDPIEVRALTQAFARSSERGGRCAIGSLKSNVGHLDAAAGVAGLIKAALAVEHAQIPASLHFASINPHIELAGSPFYVNTKLSEWPENNQPRRAGVTSLGIGGTNAHVVLEEAPKSAVLRRPKPYQVLAVSAKSASAADQALANLTQHLAAHPEVSLADAAFTLHFGRSVFRHRRAFVVEDKPEAVAALAKSSHKRPFTDAAGPVAPVFLFSGQGSQYVNMGRELYEQEPVFREALDLCARHLRKPLGIDLIVALYPPDSEKEAAAERLNQTWLTQPALFVVEYALAQWWISLGLEPTAMAGHSIGEYVAASLAGVFSLEDALDIVAARGRLIYDLPAGAMLAVPLAPSEIKLTGNISLAVINNSRTCVVSGPISEIAVYEESLSKQSVACRRLLTSHAFHSSMMDPILDAFEEQLRSISLHQPRIPYLSNVTGAWIKPEEATDPAYWARHIRSTVRFSDNLAELFQSANRVLIEVGPGNVLTKLALQQGGRSARAYSSLPHPHEMVPALRCALDTLGQLWTLGADVDWSKIYEPGSVARIPLPTYPFERQKFWIEPDKAHPATAQIPEPGRHTDNGTQPAEDSEVVSLYRRVWKPAPLAATTAATSASWLIFRDSLGVGDEIRKLITTAGGHAIVVDIGASYTQLKHDRYKIGPAVRADYDALIADLIKGGHLPTKIVHLWSLVGEAKDLPLDESLERSFLSPLYLAQALGAQDVQGISVTFVSDHLQRIAQEPVRNPARAVLLGPARAIPRELPGISTRAVDLDHDATGSPKSAAHLIAEMNGADVHTTSAWRNGARFVEALERLDLSAVPERHRLEIGDTFLITGGLGDLGLTVAEHLAREFKARLVLVSRSALPPAEEWETATKDLALSDAVKERLRKLIAIRSYAGGLLVLQADVANHADMERVAGRARAQFGRIDGVFHAAGNIDDGPLMLKSATSISKVLDPKVRGTLVVENVLRNESLKCFVLFSSISAINPAPGQVDYAAANAFLDAFAASRKGPVTSVNWGAWREIGMAARFSSPHPWLDECLLDTADAIFYSSRFSQQRQWALAEHRFKNGIGLVPGTGFLELAAAAFARGSREGAIEFHDVYFLAPLSCPPDEAREVRVELHRDQKNETNNRSFQFSVSARANGAEWIEHATGFVASCRPLVSQLDREIIASRCCKRTIVFDEKHRTRQESQLEFGLRWRSLRCLHVGNGEGLAEIDLGGKLSADVDKFRQHPALLDMATGVALYLTDDYDNCNDLFLPIAYRRMRIYSPLPARLYSHIRVRHDGANAGAVETFDATLFDDRNHVLAEIEGFAMRRIRDVAKTLENVEPSASAIRSAAQSRKIESRPGIAPSEGVRVLTQLLLAEIPVVVAARAQQVEEFDAIAAEPAPPRAEGNVPPSGATDIDLTLATWWQELLGVEQVRPEDDFFELGGHSLLGVRLFAKIKKTYKADLDLATLFEARTLRQLAEVIRKAAKPEASAPKHSSGLVAIHPNGSRIPLFLVHALGGEVLSYEQLARFLGTDQPVYAFQPALSLQEEIRRMSMEELASGYVRQLREFYPQGPYLIGGHSFGGLVAFEMARQLSADGLKPALVLLIDTVLPGSSHRIEFSNQFSTLIRNLRDEGIGLVTRRVRAKSELWQNTLFRRIQVIASSIYRLAGRPLPARLRYTVVEEMNRKLWAAYTGRPYEGSITLIRAHDRRSKGIVSLRERDDELLGWGALAHQGVDVHEVSGDHHTMLVDPNVRVVAEEIQKILSGLQTSQPAAAKLMALTG